MKDSDHQHTVFPMTSQKNLVVILCDQLRRNAVGIYGDPNAVTPNIDSLARQGVRFRNACSTYPICVPFRFSLMTGEYAHSRFVPAIEWRMSPAERTLADEFNERGYQTIYIGKWHLYGGHSHLPGHTCEKSHMTPVPRAHQGRWEKWLGFELANNPFHTHYFEDDDPTPRPLGKYQTDGLVDLAIDFLGARRDSSRPFCCVVSVEPPHPPLEAPPELERRWLEREISLPPNFFHADARPSPFEKLREEDRETSIRQRKLYYAMLENLDQNVGRLMAFLDESGLARDTTVVFLSDHGEMGGAHRELNPFKDHPFEESVGIPLIVRDPRVPERAGAQIEDATCTEDLFPTLLGLAGLRPRDPKPGLDLSPLVRGEAASTGREAVLLEFVHDLRKNPRATRSYHEVYWRALRGRRFKYSVLGGAEDGGRPWQFFDLEADPWEMHNLVDAPSHAAEVARWHRMLRERLVETGDHFVLAAAHGEEALNLVVPGSVPGYR